MSSCNSSDSRGRVCTTDGEQILIRPIGPDDREAFLDGFDRLSYDSIYDRFFEYKPDLSESDLDYFLHPNFDSHVAFVAESQSISPGEIIASFRFFRLPENPKTAEFTCIVADHFQNQGIGQAMFRHLVSEARKRGVEKFIATTLSTNDRVLRMIRAVAENIELSQMKHVREILIRL